MHDTAISGGVANRAAEVREEIWLRGQPSLSEFLKFVRDKTVGGAEVSPRVLTDEWRSANDYYYELEKTEAGIADQVECLPLDPALAALVDEVFADPRFRRTFDSVPATFGMVELDRLVAFQPHVARQFVDASKTKLGPARDPESLFRFCIPLTRPDAPIKTRRIGSRRYLLSSDSADLRFHEAAILGPHQITGYDAYGPIGAVIGLAVGFGSNFLNVIRDEDKRMMLHNGYHRAVALIELGITHAPAIIQTVTRRAELAHAASSAVADQATFYFGSARPPLLKDFFDPRIRTVLQVQRLRRFVEVQFEIREYEAAE